MRIFLVVFFSFLFVGLYAQVRNGDFGDRVDSDNGQSESQGDSLVVIARDTLSNDVFAFSLDNFLNLTYFNDTSLVDFEEYELTNVLSTPHITLGNPGSSTAPLFWQKEYSKGFNLGVSQYKPYQMTAEDIRFYNLEKAYSKVYFAPGSGSSSFRSAGIIARDFANDLKVSVHFNRVNTAPIYTNSLVKNTLMHVGLFQKIDSTRFAYSFNFISNSNTEQYNGGIEDESELYEEGGQIRSSIDVLLNDPFSFNLSRDYNLRGYYFITDKDSSKQYFQVSLDVGRELYKFINEDISTADTTVFSERLITNEIGLRRQIQNNSYESRLSYHIENKSIRSFYYLKYAWNQVSTDLTFKDIQTLYAGTENKFEWKGLSVNLDGYAGTSYNTFLLDIHPYLNFVYKRYANLTAGFRLHTEPSPYIFNEIEITETIVQDDSPFTISSQEIYGAVAIPIVGFYGKISSFAGQNIPVLNSEGTDIELENVNYVYLDIEEKLKYKWLRFNNRFITQVRNTAVYSSPTFYTEHELYFAGKLFRSLDFNGGVNVNFLPSYTVPGFSPFYGRYFANDIEDNRTYYRIDPFVSFKVQGFRFFAKYEYLNGLWDPTVLFQAANYPQLDSRFRIGVSWELRN